MQKNIIKNRTIVFAALLAFLPFFVFAQSGDDLALKDADNDGIANGEEARYRTSPNNPDTDGDGYADGNEIGHGYDPLKGDHARLPKRIEVDLSEQKLIYSYGEYGTQGSFLISSGLRKTPTPAGTFRVLKKLPKVRYKGVGYDYKNTKWNLMFLDHYYIHGAYWHNNFGKPMSHGCVNVSYKDMEGLYAFADEGTEIIIHK